MANLLKRHVSGGGGDIDSFILEITTIGASESFTFPFANTGSYTNCTIDFGDGGGPLSIATWNDANATNIYATADTYTITISADACGGINVANLLPNLRFDDIQQWGTIPFTTWSFFGCSNMIITATDIPDFTNATHIHFRICSSITTIPNINSWDISTITNLESTFSGCTNFNSDISSWDVSNVTNFQGTFQDASTFDQDISGWTLNSSPITSMIGMFQNTDSCSADISSWNVSTVQNMQNMFLGNTGSMMSNSLNGWNVSSVTSMSGMFRASTYNSPLSSWVTTSLINVVSMFESANSFNQDISNFNMSSVTNASSMFEANNVFNNGGVALEDWNFSSCANFSLMFWKAKLFNQSVANWVFKSSGTISFFAMFNTADVFDQSLATWDVTYGNNFSTDFVKGLSTANYDATLIAWELLDLTDGLSVDFGTSTYSDPGAGATAKLAIETDDSWTFTDGGGV